MTYRYVQWSRVEDFMLMGWIIGKPASEYSCFAFDCICNPEGRAPKWQTLGSASTMMR
jgi:hypothetical protein